MTNREYFHVCCSQFRATCALSEQWDGWCSENMEQIGLCADFIQQREIGGEEESTGFLRSRISSRHGIHLVWDQL